MSFKIKNRDNMRLMIKSVKILTQNAEYFLIQLYKNRMRFCQQFQNAEYHFDFLNSWFDKFQAPEELSQLESIQIECHRDHFLNSFNFLDDQEIEFLVQIDADGQNGILKVIKTRELYIIEANVPFEVKDQQICDTEFELPETDMLLDCNFQKIQKIKDLFKNKQAQEFITLNFYENMLVMKGELNTQYHYEIQRSEFENYGEYGQIENEECNQFKTVVPMRHTMSLLKICEMTKGKFRCVMSRYEDLAGCEMLFFTESFDKSFQFVIYLPGMSFQPIEEEHNPKNYMEIKNKQPVFSKAEKAKKKNKKQEDSQQQSQPPHNISLPSQQFSDQQLNSQLKFEQQIQLQDQKEVDEFEEQEAPINIAQARNTSTRVTSAMAPQMNVQSNERNLYSDDEQEDENEDQREEQSDGIDVEQLAKFHKDIDNEDFF